jgi:hypothetical protein
MILGNACKSDAGKYIKILPNTMHKTAFSLDNIAEDLIIIPLIFTEPSYISNIVWKDPYFYISTGDGEKINAIRIVSQSGEEINCLDKAGRGPGEYLSVYEFCLDSNYSIYVNTWYKIVVFDKHLNYLRDISWPKDINRAEIYMYNDNLYLFDKTSGNTVYDWVAMDTLGNILSTKEYQSYKNGLEPERYGLFIFEHDKALHRYRAIDDTIFSIHYSGWDPAYMYNRKFADGYRMYSQEELSSSIARKGALIAGLRQDHIRNISGIWGLGNDLLITFDRHSNKRVKSETVLIKDTENGMQAELIYQVDWNKGEAYYKGLPNDWAGFGALQPVSIVNINSVPHIVSFMDAVDFKNMVQSDEFINAIPKRPDLKLNYQKLADTIDNNSDPILFLLKLK